MIKSPFGTYWPGRARKPRKRLHTKSQRSGLHFPVGRYHRVMKQNVHGRMRVSVGASVYMAAVVEYLTAEVLELAGEAARDNNRRRVTPRHFMLAVMGDMELSALLRKVTIPGGGVPVNINSALIPKGHPPKSPRMPRQTPVKKAAVTTTPAKTPVAKKASTATKGGHGSAAGSGSAGGHGSAVGSGSVGGHGAAVGHGTARGHGAAVGKPMKAAGFTTLSEKKLFLGQKLSVIQGNIVDMNVDAIVHPTSDNYHMGGEVGQAIQRAGGTAFQNAVTDLHKANGPLETAEASICAGHDLVARYVIHTNGPRWNQDPEPLHLLTKTVNNCLTMANDKKLKSIAFPSIGSGRAGFPKQAAAETILRAIGAYFKSVVSSSLNQVYFVLYDMASIGIYTSELAKLDA